MPEALEKTNGTVVAFGDVVQLSKERSQDPEAEGFERYIGLEHLEPTDLKVRSWGDVVDGTTFTNVFRPGQVLFGKRRAYQRKVAVADFIGVCSGDIYVLEPKGDHLLPELLPFICQSEPFYDYVISMSQGGLSPRVNWKALAKYEFALPSLEEQRRYSVALAAVSGAIDGHARLARAVQTARDSFLKAEFGAAMTKGWKDCSFGDLAEKKPGSFGNGPFGSNLLTSELNKLGGVPVVYIRDICDGKYERQESIYVTEEKARELVSCNITRGDLLLAKVGDPPGVAVVYPSELPDAVMTQDVIRLRPDKEKAMASFLAAFLNSSVGQRAIASISVEGTRQRISTGDLKRLACPVPPIEAQERIVAHSLKMGRQVAHIHSRIGELKQLGNAILCQLSELIS